MAGAAAVPAGHAPGDWPGLSAQRPVVQFRPRSPRPDPGPGQWSPARRDVDRCPTFHRPGALQRRTVQLIAGEIAMQAPLASHDRPLSAPVPDARNVVVTIEGLNKFYGAYHVLHDINLSVREGERIVLCGPSGS